MLSISRLGKSYGARTLFAEVSLELGRGSRYGLVGANGSGKSTFLRILTGKETPSDGQFSYPKAARLGTLDQDRFVADDLEVLEVAMQGDREVYQALTEQKLLEPDTPAERVAELDELLCARGGYTLPARAAAVLVGLGIPTHRHRRPLGELSGGYRLRVQLAAVLVSQPDILLLDEPTNHLDILSIRWLEKFLADFSGCLIVISHDRRFLDQVTTHILDVDYQTITTYTGNYTAFEQQKRLVREQKEAELARLEQYKKEQLATVERFRYKASRARQAQSRLRQLDRIELAELPPSSRREPRFRFAESRPSGHDVLVLNELGHSYGETRVLSQVSFRVQRGERLAVIGPNGIGKSTLLKILAGRLAQKAGTATFAPGTDVGYFAQDQHEHFPNPEVCLLSALWDPHPRETQTSIRSTLGAVLFSGDDVDKQIGALSGGELARLVFAKLMLERPNVLLLDEPTNHLDIEAIEALVQALEDYTGTLLFVSHDRWFVSMLATRVIELSCEGYRDYPGSYSDYIAQCGDDHLDGDVVSQKDREQRREQAEQAGRDKRDSLEQRDEQRRKQNRLKALPARRDAALLRVAELEAKLAAIDDNYASPGFFERISPDELKRLEREKAEGSQELEQAMAAWEELEREITELEADLGRARG